jgi:hypothetical protein
MAVLPFIDLLATGFKEDRCAIRSQVSERIVQFLRSSLGTTILMVRRQF